MGHETFPLKFTIGWKLSYRLSAFLTEKHLSFMLRTRFGPNRPAADMEGNGEFDFW